MLSSARVLHGIHAARIALVLAVGATLLGLAGASLAGRSGLAATQSLVPQFSWSANAGFGDSLAVSRRGTTVVIGAPRDGGVGAVWVLTRRLPGERWTRTTLRAGFEYGRMFGASVAVSADGNVVLAGAPFDNRHRKGTAWIFRRSPGGVWVRQQLTPQGEAGHSWYGWSVALSQNGSTAIVGGPFDNSGKGAAWVFTRAGSTWRRQGAKLTKGGELGADRFGSSVAVSGDGRLALIGGPQDDAGVGAAWVFSRSGARWRQQGNKLRPPGPAARASFGRDVALGGANGTLALIGAPGVRAAFVFTRSGAGWRRRPRLDGPSGFGRAVAVSPDGRSAVVSSDGSYHAGTETNDIRGFLFSCSSVGCVVAPERLSVLRTNFANRALPSGDIAVASDGDAVVVSAPGQLSGPTIGGQVWVFLKWPIVQSITPPAGPAAGGTEVTIVGENFRNVRGVTFGSSAASRFTVDSPSLIRATSPRGTGDVRIRVRTAVGTSRELEGNSPKDRFTYLPPPTLASIDPASGSTDGGTNVTIRGSGFHRDAVVRFGERAAVAVTFILPTQLTAVSPVAPAGTVDVTVTTAGGTSAPSAAGRFTYVAPPAPGTVIGFDDIATSGPGQVGTHTVVNSQYASHGVSFNGVSAIDYSKGPGAIAAFAHSGSVGVEQCVGVEFCTSPIRATLSAPTTMVRVWVGFSYPLNDRIAVRLTAFAGSTGIGDATTNFPARGGPTPINTKLEVRVPTALITALEVSVLGGYNTGLAVDDVTVEKPP